MLTAAAGDAALLCLGEAKAMGSNAAFIQSVTNFTHQKRLSFSNSLTTVH